MATSRSEAFASALGVAAVVQLGLSAGAMLAEMGVLVPYWRSLPPEGFLGWYAANAERLFDFFGPLEAAGALLAVFAAVAYGYGRRPGRGAFLLAAVCAVGVLVPFPLYFQDVNDSFAKGTIEHHLVADELARWAAWHRLRTAIGVGAFAAAAFGARRPAA